MGTPLSEEIVEDVDVYGFLFDELGVRWRPAPAPEAPKAKP